MKSWNVHHLPASLTPCCPCWRCVHVLIRAIVSQMTGFFAATIGELITGKGALGQLALETNLPPGVVKVCLRTFAKAQPLLMKNLQIRGSRSSALGSMPLQSMDICQTLPHAREVNLQFAMNHVLKSTGPAAMLRSVLIGCAGGCCRHRHLQRHHCTQPGRHHLLRGEPGRCPQAP